MGKLRLKKWIVFGGILGILIIIVNTYDQLNIENIKVKKSQTFQKRFATGHIPQTQVDLRIIVIVYNRPESLKICLDSLNKVDYLGDKVALDIWIDRSKKNGKIDGATYAVARDFNFIFGDATVHNQSRHVGIIGQWLDSWLVTKDTKEIAVIFEDDVTAGPHFWKWLKVRQMFNLQLLLVVKYITLKHISTHTHTHTHTHTLPCTNEHTIVLSTQTQTYTYTIKYKM